MEGRSPVASECREGGEREEGMGGGGLSREREISVLGEIGLLCSSYSRYPHQWLNKCYLLGALG